MSNEDQLPQVIEDIPSKIEYPSQPDNNCDLKTDPDMNQTPSLQEKIKTQNSLYYVRRMKPEEESSKIISTEIDNFFNIPEKYLASSPVVIEKKIEIKDIDLNKKKQQRLKNSILEKTNTHRFEPSSLSMNKNLISNMNNNGDSSMNNRKKYELIDNDKLNNLFKSFKNKEKKSSFLLEDKINQKKIPRIISQSLMVQKKKLSDQCLTERQNKKMSKYLSKKLNIKENQLLFNNIDSYRLKKEVINGVENPHPPEENIGTYKWKLSLRMSDNFKGIRDNYFNVHKKEEPLWALVVQRRPKQKEMTLKPGIDLNCKEFSDFKKQKYFPEKHSARLRSVENLEEVNLKGKNLYDVEYNREMSSKKRKILHKIFIENGKVVLDSDVNNVFGNETFYKNYDDNNSNKNSTFINNDFINYSKRRNKDNDKYDLYNRRLKSWSTEIIDDNDKKINNVNN